jgi:hypothetical protein
MFIGHRRVIQVKILAQLWDELHLLVNTVKGQRSHCKYPQRLVSDVLIAFL